ncbi:hypothetical protein KUTeg_009209 [Tegillarca granosa]|uniref:Uncharacterized protein n=1 Tax=Tegillarca granosa TaxID=220873 RepID=A0ABQ9FAJ5_TEGGR|nr:hypothetical protein KUTeg_009209 [Tegillarca granosa]
MGNFVSRSEMLRHYFTIRGVSLVLFTGGVLYIILSRTGRKSGRKRTNYPANIVILHQIERGPFAPSYVPFAVKLETYLRMANLPYMPDSRCVFLYEVITDIFYKCNVSLFDRP